MMRGFHDETGAEVIHGYGATETTPLVALNRFKTTVKESVNAEHKWDLKRKQGLPVTGVDIKLLDAGDHEVPHDGHSVGEICVRGPWITTSYHDQPATADRFTDDGYWRSGDVGTIDEHGYLKLADRIKDVIKSGGEWISSIDMENALMAHSQVADAAVIGVPHPKWQERPLALVVPTSGSQIDADGIREHLAPQFAKWQLPETVIFTDAISRTSVGKADKKAMRAQYSDLHLTEAADHG